MAMIEQLHGARVAYYTGAYNRALKRLSDEQRQHLQGVSDSQNARYQAGLVQRSVFIGAEMQTRELEPRIEAADRAYQGAALQLAEVMGDDLTGRYPLPQLDSDLTYQPLDFDVDLYRRRSDEEPRRSGPGSFASPRFQGRRTNHGGRLLSRHQWHDLR